jgi:hypothetical protein
VIARPLRLLAFVAAVAVVSAGECEMDLGALLNAPGSIAVTNNSATEVAVVAIVADDVTSYPTLAGGQTASVTTSVGGRYQVRVAMTPESAAAYRQDLATLRSLVEKQINGATDPLEKTRLFLDLAGLKAAIQSFETTAGAGCSGNLELQADTVASVTAALRWTETQGGGFWDVTCGSS